MLLPFTMGSHFILILMVLCLKEIVAKDSVSIIFGGDVDFSRLTRYNHYQRNCSYTDSLIELKRYFDSADFAMINLETTIQEEGTTPNAQTLVPLASDESVIPALKNVGINFVSIANNHMQDFQEAGTNKTIDLLRLYGVKYSGVIYGRNKYAKQKPLIAEKNGIKVGILSYCDLNQCDQNWEKLKIGPPLVKVPNVISEVNSLRKKDGCDIVVLFMHWGVEHASVIDIGVVDIIRNLTKGAKIDLIVGAHPHVTQRHWYTRDTLIATSLGNLLFSGNSIADFNFNPGHRSPETDARSERIWYKQMMVMRDDSFNGRLLKVEFDKNGIIKKKTRYLKTNIYASKKHCLTVGKEENTSWRMVCGSGDPECVGTATCNYVECNEDEPLPGEVPDSPRTSDKKGSHRNIS